MKAYIFALSLIPAVATAQPAPDPFNKPQSRLDSLAAALVGGPIQIGGGAAPDPFNKPQNAYDQFAAAIQSGQLGSPFNGQLGALGASPAVTNDYLGSLTQRNEAETSYLRERTVEQNMATTGSSRLSAQFDYLIQHAGDQAARDYRRSH